MVLGGVTLAIFMYCLMNLRNISILWIKDGALFMYCYISSYADM